MPPRPARRPARRMELDVGRRARRTASCCSTPTSGGRSASGYDVAVWNREGVGGPPSATSLDWDTPPDEVSVERDVTQTFEFRTAALETVADEDLLRFDVQDVFDPRSLARYVIGFDPERPTPRHFLDDDLLVHFEVEWVEALLEKYQHELSLDVVRTDPPPGTSTGIGDRLVASTISWGSNTSTMQRPWPTPAWPSPTAGSVPWMVRSHTAHRPDHRRPRAAGRVRTLVVRAIPASPPGGRRRDRQDPLLDIGVPRCRRAVRCPRGPTPAATPTRSSASSSSSSHPFQPIQLNDDVALDEALAALGLDLLPIPDVPTAMLLGRRRRLADRRAGAGQPRGDGAAGALGGHPRRQPAGSRRPISRRGSRPDRRDVRRRAVHVEARSSSPRLALGARIGAQRAPRRGSGDPHPPRSTYHCGRW